MEMRRREWKKGNEIMKIMAILNISTAINIKSCSQHFIELINFLLGKIEKCAIEYYTEVWG